MSAPPSPQEPQLAGASAALVVRDRLTHDLARHYDALRLIPNRKKLLASPLYAEIQGELDRLLGGVERGEHPQPAPPAMGMAGPLCVAAWNIQRGSRFPELLAALAGRPELARADVLLLSEVDCGMGRSGNRHVARELAERLGMHYAFGVSYLVLGDDFLENPDGQPNTQALAGAAILSRLPLGRVENVDLPELRDKFSSRREKRLGKKRALLAEVLLPSGPLCVAACHLDSNAGPHGRARQMDALIRRALALGGDDGRILIGGDLNTTTYDASGPLALMRDLLHKYFVTGFVPTVEGYMHPERGYERPLFELLARYGFAIEGFNDRGPGTYFYDVMSPYAVQKLHSKVGRLLTRLLQLRLRPWNGVVPARLDWFVGRGVTPVASAVVKVEGAGGQPISDHAPITVDIDVSR